MRMYFFNFYNLPPAFSPAAELRVNNKPAPLRCWLQATPENLTAQSLTMSWLPEPKLCMAVSRTINCRTLSTSCTSSGSYTTHQTTFYAAVTEARLSGSLTSTAARATMRPAHSSSCWWGAHLPLKELSKHFSDSILADRSPPDSSALPHQWTKRSSTCCSHCPTTSRVEANFFKARQFAKFFKQLRISAHQQLGHLPQLGGRCHFCHLPPGFEDSPATGTRNLANNRDEDPGPHRLNMSNRILGL